MKKKNILNLIKYYTESNDVAFREEAHFIAQHFDKIGDVELAQYIMGLLSSTNTFSPQFIDNDYSTYFKKIEFSKSSLPLPTKLLDDLKGLMNAVERNIGVNKFLFSGLPGSGKTESVKQIGRILSREIYMVNFDILIDSKLGETQKNLVNLFNEINKLKNPSNVIILFDEIDAIAMERINSNDIREMGRTTSTFLKCIDELSPNILLIATTNLIKHFDKALLRRFDSIIDFDYYSREDLIEISEYILEEFLVKSKIKERNMKLFKKIINLFDKIPYPGDLKNIIKTSVAFSDATNSNDIYLRLLKMIVSEDEAINVEFLKNNNFTLREIEALTKISKSQLSRMTKGSEVNE